MAARRTEDGVEVTLSTGAVVQGSHVLMAVGSLPNTDDLGLLLTLALPALALHPQPTVPIGLEALAIGFPQPRVQGASRKITQGIVNGYRNNDSNQTDQGWLQISAEVSQGNSGGPVLAADGTVTVTINRLEFGQGVHTGLAMVLADELDADWAQIGVADVPVGATRPCQA